MRGFIQGVLRAGADVEKAKRHLWKPLARPCAMSALPVLPHQGYRRTCA